MNERSFVKASKGKKKLKKMELIYILNVMIIINGKFNFTHTDTPKGLPHQIGRVLNVIVRETSGDKFLEVYNKESQQAKSK